MTPIVLAPTASTRRMIGYPIIAICLVLAFAAGHVGQIIAVLLLAAFVALYVKMGKSRITLTEEGVTRTGMFGSRSIRWDEVKRYRFVSLDPTQNMYATQGGLVAVIAIAAVKAMAKKGNNRVLKSGRLTLHGEGKHKVAITHYFRPIATPDVSGGAAPPKAVRRSIDAALDFAFATLHPRLAGGTEFGDLAFDGNTLRHKKKGELPLSELDSISIASNGIVTIRKIGKRLSWASTTMSRLDNPVLLFERLADRSVRLDMSQAVFLPHPTIQLLADAATARANMPKAVVVNR